jgi:hypothetical protein
MELHSISTTVYLREPEDVAQYVADLSPRRRVHPMSITITPLVKFGVSCVEIATTAWSDDTETLSYLSQLAGTYEDPSLGSSFQEKGDVAETLSDS